MHSGSPIIERAIKAVGSAAALAHATGVTVQAVSYWRRGGRIGPERVIPFCEATGWAVTPHEVRPDLYRNVSDGLPGNRKAA